MSREGLSIVISSLILTVLLFLFSILTQSEILSGLTIIFSLLTLFFVFSFRDPKRKIVIGDNLILSPADGKIVELFSFTENKFLNSAGTRVSIFLSLLDVHINRTPISGVVRYTKYTPGKFNPSYKEQASLENERNELGLENEDLKLVLRQISGLLARRIVCRIKEGDKIKAGERFGMIKFGSRVELFLPEKVKITVKLNQKVKAGVSIIGTYGV